MGSSKLGLVTLPRGTAGPRIFKLDDNTVGAILTINNILTMTVVSKDESDFRAEYRAGFVQGKLQGGTIYSARDNSWDNAYLTDPQHTFPAQPGPTQEELRKAGALLVENYESFLKYVDASSTPESAAKGLKRLLFRMVGIYHGVVRDHPDEEGLDFSGNKLPDRGYFQTGELELRYDSRTLTFMDVYFINAYNDLLDAISSSPELCFNGLRLGDFPDKCSAFLRRSGDEIILTHNTWSGFLSQTMYQTIAVNDYWHTENAGSPGLISSGTDFGYNNKGIMYNETTHRFSRTEAKSTGVWTFWRAALAEQFSSSIQEFFDAISIDSTGTYMNGYMLADVKTKETALVEMSYRCFVYYRSKGGAYDVSAKALDDGPCSTLYDAQMVNPEYLMGINYPASVQVVSDLKSDDNRPMRWAQFKKLLPKVKNIEDAKKVITYTDDPRNPLSIFGRWDLAYGVTPAPKQVPDGSVDAKVACASMARTFMELSGTFDSSSLAAGFLMLYGTPWVGGQPFIWSESRWNWQKLRDVPDRLEGRFTLLPLFMK